MRKLMGLIVVSLGLHMLLGRMLQAEYTPVLSAGMASATERFDVVQLAFASRRSVRKPVVKAAVKPADRRHDALSAVGHTSARLRQKSHSIPAKKPIHAQGKSAAVASGKTVKRVTKNASYASKTAVSRAPKVRHAGVADKPPVLEKPIFRSPPRRPVYPPRARRNNQAGTVKVEARLNRQGDVVGVRVLQSSGFALLDQAAMAAVRGWHFQPFRRNGQALASRVIAPVAFTLG